MLNINNHIDTEKNIYIAIFLLTDQVFVFFMIFTHLIATCWTIFCLFKCPLLQ